MSSITVERTFDHPRDAVWNALADFGGIYRFHPLVEHSPLNDGPSQGLGAERTCHFYDGNHIQERVVDVQDQQAIEVEIFEGSMPLACANARFELESDQQTSTHLRMTLRYEPKFGVLGRVMDTLMMRRKFTGMMTLLLGALDEHLRTGELIGKDFRPAA